jgi:hypothetical protein
VEVRHRRLDRDREQVQWVTGVSVEMNADRLKITLIK